MPPASSSDRFDWTMGVLSVLLVAGIYQDGWAHNHGKVDQSFFTPWHFILYGTMALSGIVLFVVGLRNLSARGVNVAGTFAPGNRAAIRDSIPTGYWSAVAGVVIFIVGGGLDLAWHTIFGIEASIDALVSPTHLVLALGAALVCSGPIRSTASRYGQKEGGWRHAGPAVLGVTAVLALVGFFTQYAQPIGDDGIAAVIAKNDDAAAVDGLYVMNADGSHQERLFPALTDDSFGPSVSPDGRSVVYRVSSNGAPESDLYVGRVDGSGKPARITHSGRHDTQPAWSPDGKWIAYVSSPAGTSGEFQLDVVHPDGSGQRVVLHGVATLDGPAWSPDGRRIAVSARNGVDDQVEVVDASSGSAKWVSGALGDWPSWSKDGSSVYFSRSDDQGNATSIAVVPAAGAANDSPQAVADGGASMSALSADGDMLAFVRQDKGSAQVFVAGADGRDPVDVSLLSGMDASRPAWANRKIVFAAIGRSHASQSDYALALSLAGMLLQAIVVIGALLMLVRRWRMPFGAMTVVVVLFSAALATQNDDYFAIPAALVAGLAADMFIASRGEAARRAPGLYVVGFGVPFLLTAGYVVAIALARGLGWPPNMAIGSPFIAGVAGLLVAFAYEPPSLLARGPAV
jgi:Tol biopolymer transport system component